MRKFRYRSIFGKPTVERRGFVWIHHYLPLVTLGDMWDGQTYAFVWLRVVWLRGTSLGWETVVDEREPNDERLSYDMRQFA